MRRGALFGLRGGIGGGCLVLGGWEDGSLLVGREFVTLHVVWGPECFAEIPSRFLSRACPHSICLSYQR